MNNQCPKATMRDGQIYCRNTTRLCIKQYFDTMGQRYKLGADVNICPYKTVSDLDTKQKRKAGRPKKNG